MITFSDKFMSVMINNLFQIVLLHKARNGNMNKKKNTDYFKSNTFINHLCIFNEVCK